MKRTVIITQARTGSSRLPNKVLKEVIGKTFLEIHLYRALKFKKADALIVATTDLPKDDPILSIAEKYDLPVYRGSENDVLDRYYQAAKLHSADIVIRITSDCPLIDPELIEKVATAYMESGKDYVTNTLFRTYPDGMDVEIFSFKVLEKAWNEATEASDREHVTPYIWRNSDFHGHTLFSTHNVESGLPVNYGELRMTLDYPEDQMILTDLLEKNGPDKSWLEYTHSHKERSTNDVG